MANVVTTTINFHGAELIAIEGKTPSEILVAMKPIVEDMGLGWASQFKKINRHPVIAEGIVVMTIPSGRGDQDTVLISLDMLNFWLATIHPDRIKNEATRAKIIAYQIECARVLFNHFFGKTQTGIAIPTPEIPFVPISDAEQIVSDLAIKLAEVEKQSKQTIKDAIESAKDAIERMNNHGRAVGWDFQGFITSRQILRRFGRGARATHRASLKVSYDVQKFLIFRGLGHMVRISQETGRYLYHVDGVEKWIWEGNGVMMLEHVKAEQSIQPSLQLVK